MPRSKHDEAMADEATPPTPREQYEEAIDTIACGTRKLTEAGMGGPEAGKLAAQVWQQTCGGNAQPPAE